MGAFLKNCPHTPKKLLKVGMGVAVKFEQRPQTSRNARVGILRLPTQMFLFKNEQKLRFATPYIEF